MTLRSVSHNFMLMTSMLGSKILYSLFFLSHINEVSDTCVDKMMSLNF